MNALKEIFAKFKMIIIVLLTIITVSAVTAWLILLAFGAKHKKAVEKAPAEKPEGRPPSGTTGPAVVTFPISGSGYATKQAGIKAYLNPLRTYTRANHAAKYVFANDPAIFFDDVDGPVGMNKEQWFKMPAGNYIVYPLKEDKIEFRWWQ